MDGPTEVPGTDQAIADPGRRFYAFLVDRLLAWGLIALAALVGWQVWFRNDVVGPGVALILAVAALVLLGTAAMTGLAGASPGKYLTGLRVVAPAGGPIGLGRALLRGLILAVTTLPTFGLGVATLAWTAVTDPGHRRRGWHDRVCDSLVVDVRHRPAAPAGEPEARPGIVNLTALRLQPAAETPPPAPMPRPEPAAPPAPPGPVAADGGQVLGARTPAAPTPTDSDQQAAGPASAEAPRPAAGMPSPETAPPRAEEPYPEGPHPRGPETEQPRPDRPQPSEPPVGVRPAGARTVDRDQRDTLTRYTWRLEADTGESLRIAGLALIGRDPEARPGEHVQHLLPLTSSDMSLSKTHAQVHLAAEGALVIMDRGSTNGSVLIRQGISRALPADRPATLLDGDRLRLGDRDLRVVREG